LFAADTWTIASTWLRNTLLNLLILITFLGAALLTPRIATFVLLHLHAFVSWLSHGWDSLGAAVRGALLPITPHKWDQVLFDHHAFVHELWIYLGVALGGALLWAGCVLIGKHNLATFGLQRDKLKSRTRGDDDSHVVSRILPLVMVGAFVEVALIWYSGEAAVRTACPFAAVVLVGIAILSSFSNSWKKRWLTWRDEAKALLHITLAVAGSAAVGWVLVYGLYSIFQIFGKDTERGVWIAASVGAALMLLVIAGVVVIFIGLLGNDLPDEQREWWGRMGAWLSLAVAGWLAICAICFFMPW
jgi:hypothetical protein